MRITLHVSEQHSASPGPAAGSHCSPSSGSTVPLPQWGGVVELVETVTVVDVSGVPVVLELVEPTVLAVVDEDVETDVTVLPLVDVVVVLGVLVVVGRVAVVVVTV